MEYKPKYDSKIEFCLLKIFDNLIICYVSISSVFLFYLWSPHVIGQTIIFLPCDSYLSFFFPSPNLSGRRLDVYHTSTHGVALVRI